MSQASHPSPVPHDAPAQVGASLHAGRLVWWLLAAVALVVHCWLIYSTNPPGSPPFAGADKLAHLLIFGGTAWLFAMAGVRWLVLWPIALAHAIESELVQHFWVPGRSGSPVDAAADLVGVALAWCAWAALRPRGPGSSR